jgi:hypothetical protein
MGNAAGPPSIWVRNFRGIAACHIKGEFHSSQGKQVERDNIGGWRDAGVYGRYVVNYGLGR